MKVRSKKTGQWIEIPDGPTEAEEAEMERYKARQATPWMQFYDSLPKAKRRIYARDGHIG